MNVSLTHELEEFVNNKVQSGTYTSTSEVVRDGLRLLVERNQLYRIRLEALRKAVHKDWRVVSRSLQKRFFRNCTGRLPNSTERKNESCYLPAACAQGFG
jgi:putative addiction module CopG family antidote